MAQATFSWPSANSPCAPGFYGNCGLPQFPILIRAARDFAIQTDQKGAKTHPFVSEFRLEL